MENKYYVYEWIRLDTNEPFYVGKGCGNRAYQIYKSRNAGFMNVFRKTECAVVILADNLTEEEAYEAEIWFIYEYKYIYNFSLVNLDEGGLGAVSGKFNHMYGRKGPLHPNYGIIVSDETRRKQSISRSGKRNGMYGKKGEKSPIYGRKMPENERLKIVKALKGKQKTEDHKRKISESRKGKYTGKDNPNYGNGEKMAGGKNPASVKIKAINNQGETVVFETKTEACLHFKISKHLFNTLIGKVISVDKDFTRMKNKYRHLEGWKFDLFDEGVTTS